MSIRRYEIADETATTARPRPVPSISFHRKQTDSRKYTPAACDRPKRLFVDTPTRSK